MALVAYDNSDSSEFEDEDEPMPVNIAETDPTRPDSNDLFKCLPRPNTKSLVEEDDEFVTKKEQVPLKIKARITIPSLSDFKDVDSPVTKVQKPPSKKGSGLLGLLPQPKYFSGTTAISMSAKNPKKPSTSLIPHVLQKSTNSIETSFKKSSSEISSLHYSDDSDEDLQNDFFSINKSENVIPVSLPSPIVSVASSSYINEEFDNQSSQQQSQVFVAPVHPQTEHAEVAMDQIQAYQEENQPQTSNSHQSSLLELDEEAIRKLCGSRKRKGEVINILDVDQKDVLGDAAEMLMKGIMDDTAPRMSSSKRKGDGPTSQQKRKHQITYLAHQAKANEADLQNQWANNRINKRMTQSKYGF